MTKISLPNFRAELTKNEQMFMNSWSDDKYHLIRSVIAKGFVDLTPEEKRFSQKARTLLNMFDKYESSHPKDEVVFRGLRFNKSKTDEVNKFNYLKDNLKNSHKSNDMYQHSIAPFSTSKFLRIARGFANADIPSHSSIILVLSKRISNELDISTLSSASESEILIQGRLKYKIIEYTTIQNIVYATLEETL